MTITQYPWTSEAWWHFSCFCALLHWEHITVEDFHSKRQCLPTFSIETRGDAFRVIFAVSDSGMFLSFLQSLNLHQYRFQSYFTRYRSFSVASFCADGCIWPYSRQMFTPGGSSPVKSPPWPLIFMFACLQSAQYGLHGSSIVCSSHRTQKTSS